MLEFVYADSLQKESLLCGLMMAVTLLLLFLLPLEETVVAVVVILGENEKRSDDITRRADELGFGVQRRWKWSRKKMKWNSF